MLGLLALPAPGRAAVVTGSNTGVFVNPSAGATTTGVGTSSFTFGTPANNIGPNSLNYSPDNPIDAMTEEAFRLGTLTFFNGTVFIGSEATSVDLAITLDLTEPGVVTEDFAFSLGLVSTPNTSDPDASADFVFFPSAFTDSTFTAGGETYTLELLGFFNVVGDGFLTSDSTQFNIREGSTATADLFGRVTTNIPSASSVPEPTSLVTGLLTSILFGLSWVRRRARGLLSSLGPAMPV